MCVLDFGKWIKTDTETHSGNVRIHFYQYSFVWFGKCKVFTLSFLLLFPSRLPRRQGSVLYCTTGIILQWLRSDPWVSLIPAPSSSSSSFFSVFPLSISVPSVLHLLSYSPCVTRFYPHWFVFDSAVCGRSISMGPHTPSQRKRHTHTHSHMFCWLIPACSSLHSECFQKTHRDWVRVPAFLLVLFHAPAELARLEWVILKTRAVWQNAAMFGH